MKTRTLAILFATALLGAVSVLAAPSRDYPVHAIPFTEVTVADAFWSPRLETNRLVTIPYAFQQSEETGRINNFAKAGGLMEGGFQGIFFNDSDVFKIIEGAAYALALHPDPKLETYVDGVIDKIAAAQEDDGYLYCSRTLCTPDNMPPGGKDRWTNIRDGHELYNVGHLYEGAAAYFQATGKRKLLDVALKNADLICEVFGPGRREDPPGHEQIEIGLARLYRLTGEEKYLRQAKFFLDARGRPEGHALYGDYSQDHKPVVDQEEAVGHSVRAAYLYTGMADVAALTADPSYVTAIQRIWGDVVNRKLYITGGIGAAGGTEGFGAEYFLPNRTAYCETCASVANAMWNHRMFLWTGDGPYMDVAERVIYNAFLSGISMQGDRFFYPNRLESFRSERRQPWFSCACCPANIVRFVPSIPGYAYAQRDRELFVNLFISGGTKFDIAGRKVQLNQESRYPWDGRIQLTLNPDQPARFALRLRIPGWARNEVTPGTLYRFANPVERQPQLLLNGEGVAYETVDGYARVDRTWSPGDRVEFRLPMPVRRVLADERVEADRGRVALQRGPLMFCLEGVDQPEGHTLNLAVEDDTPLWSEFRPDLLGGVQVVTGHATLVRRGVEEGRVEAAGTQDFTAIPYHAWAHREPCAMTVWPARELPAARPLPGPTLAHRSRLTVSAGSDPAAMTDQFEPANSIDHSNPYFHWWPRKGTREWVHFELPETTEVSQVQVYWFDDTGMGECRIPGSWRAFARIGGEWREVGDASDPGTATDRYNVREFKPVRAQAIRLEVLSQPEWAGGIHEVRLK